MSRMWVSFVHDGNPNFDDRKYLFLVGAFRCGLTSAELTWISENAQHWPSYRLRSPNAYVFDANVSSYVEQDNYRKAQMDYIASQFLLEVEPWSQHDKSW